jgi:site-specific DNA-methyltransferase (adenine-specific)
MSIDLRLGDWRDVLADVECDALITDPPYGARTHEGHDAVEGVNGDRQSLSYASWGPDDVCEFVGHWAQRTRGWMCVMSCTDLANVWRDAFHDSGRYAFHSLPCVIRGASVRLAGDGPSSWSVCLTVSRPRNKKFSTWGTLPGAYVGKRRTGGHIGGKPDWLMSAIIRDYTRPGDLVCDPCAGGGTTLVAAESLGRKAVGAEIDPETHAKAMARIRQPLQRDMFA